MHKYKISLIFTENLKSNMKKEVKHAHLIIDRTGEVHTTNEGYEVEIIEYITNKDCSIRFNCGHIIRNIRYECVKDGRIRNVYHPSVCGIGYVGEGKYSSTNDKQCYEVWRGMIRRCYEEKILLKHPTYRGCSVHTEWKCFQVFAKWYYKNYRYNFNLDKDILKKGNKVYSPKTCCFVPHEINCLFTKSNGTRGKYPIGVSFHKQHQKFYSCIRKIDRAIFIGLFNTIEEAFQAYKKTKEDHIKEKADEWKDRVEQKVYKAMYNWVVEITD